MTAAVRVARRVGVLDADGPADPVVLHQGANLVVHLRPAPVVARVAHLTALVRRDAAAHLALELDLARLASDQGADVVGPLAHDAGVHHEPEGPMTLWPLVPRLRSGRDAATAGRALAAFHRGVRAYPGWMPGPENVAADAHRGVLLLARLGLLATPEAVEIGERNREALVEMRSLLDDLATEDPARLVPLHGDPHGGNLLDVDGRATWWDLDDAWRGPAEWDLAVMAGSELFDGAVAVAAYREATGFRPDDRVLTACRTLRAAQRAAWGALYGALDGLLERDDPVRSRTEAG